MVNDTHELKPEKDVLSVTWEPVLGESSQKSEKDSSEPTPWEKYLQRRKAKRKVYNNMISWCFVKAFQYVCALYVSGNCEQQRCGFVAFVFARFYKRVMKKLLQTLVVALNFSDIYHNQS